MVSQETIDKVWEVYRIRQNPIMSRLKTQMEEVIRRNKEIDKMIEKLKYLVDEHLIDMRSVKKQVDEVWNKLQEIKKENEH